jgi:hypothetical protein
MTLFPPRRGSVGAALHALGRFATVPPSPACGAIRRGGRAVEGARLESVYGGNSIAGSNPAPSANFVIIPTNYEEMFP